VTTATIPGAGVMIKDMADDEAIQATNDDASECKRYAVQLGYWCDPFINLFVKQTTRKAPEINRGYCARVMGIELFVDKFLKVSVSALRHLYHVQFPLALAFSFICVFLSLSSSLSDAFCSRGVLFITRESANEGVLSFEPCDTRPRRFSDCTFCTFHGLSVRVPSALFLRSFILVALPCTFASSTKT
jgi:hypothetical protein